MEGKKEIKISLVTVICMFIIFSLIIVLFGMWYYYNNKNILTNKVENSNDANELNLNSELITELYSYIPVIVSSNRIEENAYQSELVKKEDLETEYLLACAFKKLNLLESQKQRLESAEEWYTFDAEILQEKVKQIYGEKLENKSFDIGYGKGCSYENGKYLYSFGGGSDEGVYSIREIQKAYKKNNDICIVDRYMILKQKHDADTSKVELYNTSDDSAELIANLDFEKITSMDKEKLEKELIMQYRIKMQTYEHTFKKNDNGGYYWYSTEPISYLTHVKIAPAKPIIYLYPQETTEVTVKLGNPERITSSYPEYKEEWKVVAESDGTLTDVKTQRKLYALYWEGKDMIQPEMTEGFIVKGQDTIEFLEEKLEILGLNEKEIQEFIIYWLPKMQNNTYNYIRFATIEEINNYMPLELSVEPDTLIRVLMQYKPLDEYIEVKEQELLTRERTGFTVVEWGGTEMK